MTDWTSRLAIISDEADDSFAAAVDYCLPLGIRAYELRKLEGGRFPGVTERALQEVADTVAAHDLELIGVSPGFFKGPLQAEVIERTFDDDLPQAFRLMERLGIRQMTLFTFRRNGPDDPIPAEIYDHLGRAIELCAREGIEVVLENAASIYSNTGANLADHRPDAGRQGGLGSGQRRGFRRCLLARRLRAAARHHRARALQELDAAGLGGNQ